MRINLTVIVLITAILQVSANSYAQKITLSEKNVQLTTIFEQINRQTGYDFLVSTTILKDAKLVNINVKNAELEEVLKKIFDGQPLKYAINNRSVVVSRKEKGFLDRITDYFVRPVLVKGRVTDDDDKPISGVNIKGTGASTLSNSDGYYNVGTEPNSILTFTYVGYKKLTVKVGDKQTQTVNVSMKLEMNKLDEVIVIPYGTVKKRESTGAISSVSAADIEKQPVMNVLQTLAGRVPGMIVTQQSGVPGSNVSVQIRGRNSIENKGEPLYIIDGVPFTSGNFGQIGGNVTTSGTTGVLTVSGVSSAAGSAGFSPFNSLNPADIESIEVFKDADATAIYGSRGANGVILITTKKGKSGPTRINFLINNGINKVSTKQKYLTTPEFLSMRREAFRNDGTTPGTNDPDLNGTWDQNRYTDWSKELIQKSSTTTTAQLSLTGGTEQTQFLIGAGYTMVSPPYDGDFSNQRTSINFNINNASADQKLKLGLSGSYSVNTNNLPGMDVTAYLSLPPNAPALRNPDGTLNWAQGQGNPYAALLQAYNGDMKALVGNGSISYQILPDLQIKSTFGYTNSQYVESRINPLAAISPFTQATSGSSLFGNRGSNTWIVEPQINYAHKIYKGMFSVFVGGTLQSNVAEGQTISGINFSSDAVLNNINAAGRTLINNSYTKYRYQALFGRVNYSLQGKYILNLSGRRDGSSRFGPDNTYANFGAIGAAWIFSDEPFIKRTLKFLSFGKFRGSYGLTGNDQIGDYRYLDSYTPTGNYSYYGMNGLYPTRMYNSTYTWESNKKREMAVELGFLKDRISIVVSNYRNRASNQLTQNTLPPTTGNISVQANLPATVENSGWEYEFNTTNIKATDFSWNSAFNISFAANKLIAFPGLASSPYYKDTYVIGQSLSTTKLYKYAGINPTTGLYMFVNSKGVLTSAPGTADRTELFNLTPRFHGGFNNGFRYKQLQLDVFAQFVKQKGRNLLMGPPDVTGNYPGGLANLPRFVIEQSHWQQAGDITDRPKYTLANNGNLGAVGLSDMGYTDASYIRIKTVALSYSLQESWLKPLHIKSGRVYVNAQNLFTITNYMGLDPESQGAILPPLKTIVFGAQFSL